MKPLNTVAIAAALFLSSGCAASAGDNETMYRLGSALTKLSATVEATVYKEVDPTLTDETLLLIATQHDPELLAPFDGYRLRARIDHQHAVVLVCSANTDRALLEDAGCTAKLDRHLWAKPDTLPCRFTLVLERVCPAAR